MKKNLFIGSTLAALLLALGLGQGILEKKADAQAKGNKIMVPRFEVDPTFPKPLPNHWYQGMSIGVGVDANDHVWIVHRPDTVNALEAAEGEEDRRVLPEGAADSRVRPGRHAAPPLGRRRTAPATSGRARTTASPSTTRATSGSAATAQGDGMVLKFTQDGKFLMQVGKKGVPIDSNSTEHFGMVAKISIDKKENEAYISDGYGNKRVVVIDADTGKFKRYWGAYGNKPDDTESRPLQSGRAGGAAVPHPGALRRDVGRPDGLRLRPRQRPHPGVHARRQVRQGGVGQQAHARRRLDLGHRVLERSAAEVHLPRRRQGREGVDPRSRSRSRS